MTSGGPPQPIRVVLIEDDAGTAAGLSALISLSSSLKLMGAFRTAEDALIKIGALQPDVVVTDLMLPGKNGIECILTLRDRDPECRVLVLTAFGDNEMVMDALRAGASGYLIKDEAPSELLRAIQDVAAGGSPMSAAVARLVVQSFHQPSPPPKNLSTLTGREKEVLQLLAKGTESKEAAAQLGISYETLRLHLRHIYRKLHVNTRTQAILKYMGSQMPSRHE